MGGLWAGESFKLNYLLLWQLLRKQIMRVARKEEDEEHDGLDEVAALELERTHYILDLFFHKAFYVFHEAFYHISLQILFPNYKHIWTVRFHHILLCLMYTYIVPPPALFFF